MMMSRPINRPVRTSVALQYTRKIQFERWPQFYDFHIRCECLKINIYIVLTYDIKNSKSDFKN